MYRIASLFLVVCGLALFSAAPTHAQLKQGFGDAQEIAAANDLSTTTPAQIIRNIINVGLSFVGLIATAVLIYSGVGYMTSSGDEKKAARAKARISYAVIGLLLIGGAALIVNLVIFTFDSSGLGGSGSSGGGAGQGGAGGGSSGRGE